MTPVTSTLSTPRIFLMASSNMTIDVGKHNANKHIKVYAGDDHVLTSGVNKRGEITLKRKSKNGKRLEHLMNTGRKLRFEPVF